MQGHLVGLGFCISLAACNGGGDGGPFVGQVSRSRFFEYHDRATEPLCPTLLSLLDQHAQLIGGKIGLNPESSIPYRYFKFSDLSDLTAYAGGISENGALALGDAVYSSTFFHAHEQAHDYAFRAWGGWSTGLLNEGEAVALSCLPNMWLKPTERPRDYLGALDWRDNLHLYGNSIAGYTAAGFWVTYLVKRYGWQRVGELYRRVPDGISAEDFDQEFARVFPISMDQAWTEALNAPGALPCEIDWECMGTSMKVGEIASPDCDDEVHRSVTVTDQSGVVLTLSGVDTQVVLRSCAAGPALAYGLTGGGTERTTHWASLPPGTYAMFADSFPTPRVEFRSYMPQKLLADTCDSAETLALDPNQFTYVDLLAGPASGWMRLAGGGRPYSVQPYNLNWKEWPSGTGAPVVCESCDASATCVPLPIGATSVVIGDRAALHLQGILSIPAAYTQYGQLIFTPGQPGDAGP